MSSQNTTYEAKNVTIRIERYYSGDKTAKEMIFELLQKRYASVCLRRR